MKANLLSVAIFLAIVSCTSSSNEKQSPEMSALKSEVDKAPTKLATNEEEDVSDEPEVYEDFGEFWSEFREAVQENDMEDVMEMTNFPFETRGEMDSDPIIKYNEKQMKKVLPLLMEQEIIRLGKGTDLYGITEAQGIIEMKSVPAKDIQGESVRPGDSNFVFEKTKNGWKFVFAYVNEPTYEKIGK